MKKFVALAKIVEALYQKAKSRISKFSLSVLVKAFQGEFVPEDPNDKPAKNCWNGYWRRRSGCGQI